MTKVRTRGKRVYYFKTKPMRHQVRALKKFLKTGCGALFAEMGTGKTKIAIDWVGCLCVKENRRLRVVVACPKSVISVWPEEIEKHDPWGEIPHSGPIWKIVSIDSIWRPHLYDELALWKPDVIIIDESDMIKSVGARRSKGAYLLSKRIRYRLVMSGTPIGKTRLDLFAQYKVVNPSIFGTSYGAFKSEYAITRAYKVVKYLRTRKFRRVIRPYTFAITKDKCLDLPERRGHVWDPSGPNIVHVPLSRKTREAYDELARESIIEMEDFESVTPIVLVQMLRLSQLTSGWLGGTRPSTMERTAKKIGSEKQMQLENDLDEMMHADVKKVVVYCRFRHELLDAQIAARRAGYNTLLFYGDVSAKRRLRKRKAFYSTDKPTVFISQWQTGARGLNELVASNQCICYGLIYSLILYSQGIDRLHRKGQTNKVTYRHYVAPGTIDETVVDSLREKKSTAKEILEHPELVYGTEERA
jgi:SNF2 family DNA or RNA helicase